MDKHLAQTGSSRCRATKALAVTALSFLAVSTAFAVTAAPASADDTNIAAPAPEPVERKTVTAMDVVYANTSGSTATTSTTDDVAPVPEANDGCSGGRCQVPVQLAVPEETDGCSGGRCQVPVQLAVPEETDGCSGGRCQVPVQLAVPEDDAAPTPATGDLASSDDQTEAASTRIRVTMSDAS